MIQGDMNYCVAAEYKKVDKKLNQIYQEILKHISDKREQVNLLKKSPNLWIKYRDAYKKEFEAMLKCEEGDLSCPFIIKTQNLGFFVDISS
ncbi:lysozyme inhibitor LprI family protein [Rickettsia sibirica]|uniref:lysozyme inhibitor LprI family protein n=1 Tax=Rickettsia sibirica TaxID=35793 RepID=UPI0002FE7837|nr:lysozyme inhibitor LprI family protein [Rickettsia sibirica]